MLAEIFVMIWKIIGYLVAFCFILIVVVEIYNWKMEKVKKHFARGLKSSDENVRKAYVMKMDDDNALKKVALTDSSTDIRILAVERIKNRLVLDEIIQKGSGYVSNASQRRVDELQ